MHCGPHSAHGTVALRQDHEGLHADSINESCETSQPRDPARQRANADSVPGEILQRQNLVTQRVDTSNNAISET